MNLVRVEHINKTYKKAIWPLRVLGVGEHEKSVLSDISFSISAGEIICLLGKNGSGKTTLLKILSTIVKPSSGKCYINDKDIFFREIETKKNLSYVYGDERSFFWRISVFENLRFFGILRGLSAKTIRQDILDIINICQLSEIQNNPVNLLSAGERQKLSIARGLLGFPKILYMDEVTRSLDPPTAKHIREFIQKELRDKKKCAIIFATHNMVEAKEMADRILFIDSGKILAQGTFHEVSPTLEKMSFV